MTQTLTFVLADVGDGDGHMNWNGSWWMWIWGPLMMIAVVVLIVWLIRAATNPGAPRTAEQREPTERAKEILAERYASGEITTEEYRERRDHLQ